MGGTRILFVYTSQTFTFGGDAAPIKTTDSYYYDIITQRFIPLPGGVIASVLCMRMIDTVSMHVLVAMQEPVKTLSMH